MIAGGEIEGDADQDVVVSDDFIEGLPSGSTKGEPSIPSRPSTQGDVTYFLNQSQTHLMHNALHIFKSYIHDQIENNL